MPDPTFYDKLYPLQDDVLRAMSGVTDFYLTGGTAVSRFHFQHRYSDDLDLFLNNSKTYRPQVLKVISVLKQAFPKVTVTMEMESFFRFFVENEEGTVLKVEMINDVGFHFGDFHSNDCYHRIDNSRNILSNKICALSRNAAKDVSDIIAICENKQFFWPDIFIDANKKDTWTNALSAIHVLSNMGMDKLLTDVSWIKAPDPELLQLAITNICTDIAHARKNSLFQKP